MVEVVRENVVKALEDSYRYSNVEGRYTLVPQEVILSAIDLLKEHEPTKPTINEDGEAFCVCGENVGIIPHNWNLPSVRLKYCPGCGRRMNWDERVEQH